MHPTLVAFDESGNTGQNLLDPSQPVFTLASVRLERDVAMDMLTTLLGASSVEAKFSALKNSKEGKRALLRLFDHEIWNREHVKVALIHKSFLVTTKIVDLLIEPLCHQLGYDLYRSGQNLGLANLVHATTGPFCGVERYAELQKRFVRWVREPNPETIKAFYDQLKILRRKNTHPPFDAELSMLAATEEIAAEAIQVDDLTAIDPAIPTFVDLAAQWTALLKADFEIVHDESKPIARDQERLERLMATDTSVRSFKLGQLESAFPIRATGINFAASHAVPQLQVADLVAGGVAYFFGRAAQRRQDDFGRAIAKTRIIQDISPIWPDHEFKDTGESPNVRSESLNFVIDLASRNKTRVAP
ncbi:MAG: DUF3800 domain-containing protein [Gemmatimonadaceae bacterium]